MNPLVQRRLLPLAAVALIVGASFWALSHDAPLTRALVKLEAARTALTEDLPDRHVRRLLADAEKELDRAARELGRADYRPATYLASVS